MGGWYRGWVGRRAEKERADRGLDQETEPRPDQAVGWRGSETVSSGCSHQRSIEKVTKVREHQTKRRRCFCHCLTLNVCR